MKIHVGRQDGGLSVRIENLAGREDAVLEAVRECRKSAWACPSGECMNIGTMEALAEEGAVFLTLTPRPGAELSPTAIEECLHYMLLPLIKA